MGINKNTVINRQKRTKKLESTHFDQAFDEEKICFSKSALMHDTVIGLLITKVEFGLDIRAKPHI